MALTDAERDGLRRSGHPAIDSYSPERLDKLEKALREVQAYQEAEREREQRRPKPTEYLYDQTGRRRVRFGIDGSLKEETPVPMLGWWPREDRTFERRYFIALALIGAFFLGSLLEMLGLLPWLRAWLR